MRVTLFGTRGSLAAPGAETNRYGGNTSTVEVCADDGTLLVLDAGTGIRRLAYKAWERTAHRKIIMRHPPATLIEIDQSLGSRYTPSTIGGVSALMLCLRRENDRHAH
jgi:hypothetical protein